MSERRVACVLFATPDGMLEACEDMGPAEVDMVSADATGPSLRLRASSIDRPMFSMSARMCCGFREWRLLVMMLSLCDPSTRAVREYRLLFLRTARLWAVRPYSAQVPALRTRINNGIGS